jgi:hypothetical protein
MAIEIGTEIQNALRDHAGEAVPLVDPTTKKHYRLIAEEQYQRWTAILDSPWSPEEQLLLLRDAGRRAGWDDAAMDAYDRLDDSTALS